MSNQPFNAALHPRAGDGTFTATAHSDAVPALAAPANRFAGIDDIFELDRATTAAMKPFLSPDPSSEDEAEAEKIRAEWLAARNSLCERKWRRENDEYAEKMENEAYALLDKAARANLRNISYSLRAEYPDAASMTLARDYDEGNLAIYVESVKDSDGQDLDEDAREAAQQLVSEYSSRQVSRFVDDGPVNLTEAAAWHPGLT